MPDPTDPMPGDDGLVARTLVAAPGYDPLTTSYRRLAQRWMWAAAGLLAVAALLRILAPAASYAAPLLGVVFAWGRSQMWRGRRDERVAQWRDAQPPPK